MRLDREAFIDPTRDRYVGVQAFAECVAKLTVAMNYRRNRLWCFDLLQHMDAIWNHAKPHTDEKYKQYLALFDLFAGQVFDHLADKLQIQLPEDNKQRLIVRDIAFIPSFWFAFYKELHETMLFMHNKGAK